LFRHTAIATSRYFKFLCRYISRDLNGKAFKLTDNSGRTGAHC
jgi:hypothetical protein